MAKQSQNNNPAPGDKPRKDGPPPIRLPFEQRKREPGEWIFEHRTAIFVTVIVYLVFAIVFVFSRIVINAKPVRNEIVFNMEDLEKIEELQKQLERAAELNRLLNEGAAAYNYNDVRNIVSNENARVEELNQNDQQVQDRLRESRDRFAQGNDEIRMMEEAARNRGEGEQRENVKVEGRVTVSFSLTNPPRTASYLYVPAYKCESGGTVVVNITVNPNGDVIAASVDKSLSSSDYCMTTTALDAAQRSRFNVHPGAPAKQTGTITYVFIPQ